MTLYRKRLTSSFYAIKESLQRRLNGINITPEDFGDLEDADDTIIEGLESYFESVDPQEIQYLENLLRQFENTGEDSKLSYFISILRQELIERESAIAFTQYIERAAMSADPEEEGVLLAEFDQVLNAPPLRPALDEMVARDVEADLLEIGIPIPLTPIAPQALEQLLTNSQVVKGAIAIFERLGPQIWQLNYQGKTYQVTFYPKTFDEKPSLQYMSWGNPLFEQLLDRVRALL